MNAHEVGEVALAGATSNLFAMLADSYRRSKRIQAGDEIIIHDASHEVSNTCSAACAHLDHEIIGSGSPLGFWPACTLLYLHSRTDVVELACICTSMPREVVQCSLKQITLNLKASWRQQLTFSIQVSCFSSGFSSLCLYSSPVSE